MLDAIVTYILPNKHYLHPGAYEGKERISHIDTMVISKNKVILADSRAG